MNHQSHKLRQSTQNILRTFLPSYKLEESGTCIDWEISVYWLFTTKDISTLELVISGMRGANSATKQKHRQKVAI